MSLEAELGVGFLFFFCSWLKRFNPLFVTTVVPPLDVTVVTSELMNHAVVLPLELMEHTVWFVGLY